MYYVPYMNQHPYPYYVNIPMYYDGRDAFNWTAPYQIQANRNYSFSSPTDNRTIVLTDHGPKPYVVNINAAAKQNNTFRTALWTGTYFQVTLMSLNAGDDIGLEMHPDVDQFLRVEQGQGMVRMGKSKNNLTFQRHIFDDSAIVIPAGTWHNLTNTGTIPLKLYSIYAPPNHPFGTVHHTKAAAMSAEE